MIDKILNNIDIKIVIDYINENFSLNSNEAINNISLLINKLKEVSLRKIDIIYIINTCDILNKNIKTIISNNDFNILSKDVLELIKYYQEIDMINENDYASEIREDLELIKAPILRNLPNKVLTFKEIIVLFKKIEQGDMKAREKVIFYNLRLVVSVAKKYVNMGVEFEDLIQAGNEGLILAVDRYDYNKGLSFSNYAIYWIKQSIMQVLSFESRTIKVPMHVHKNILKIKKYIYKYMMNNDSFPSPEEIVENLEISINQVKDILPLLKETISLNDKVPNGNSSDLLIMDTLKSCTNIEEDYIEQNSINELKNYIFNELDISERDKMIIAYRFGFIDGKVYKLYEIGNMFNLTRERVRQIECDVIKILKKNNYIKNLFIK